MEAFSNIISALNDNAFGLAALVGLAIVVIVGIKKGWFVYKSDKLRIGMSEEDTRNLIRAQWDYSNAKCEGMISKLPKDLNIYHTKYVIARVEDVLQRMILFNNMSTKSAYIKSKQELVYQTIMKRVDNGYFMTDDFKDLVYEFVENLIKELVAMKETN